METETTETVCLLYLVCDVICICRFYRHRNCFGTRGDMGVYSIFKRERDHGFLWDRKVKKYERK